MATDFPRITLLAPGCFSAVEQTDEGTIESEHSEVNPEVNASSVMATTTQSYEQALAEALHQIPPELGDLPIAQHRYGIDTGHKTPSMCVCAEFIHLQADKDNARLFPIQALGVTDNESEQLLGALNDLIRDDGLEVVRTGGNHYYLTGMSATALDTWPAHTVASGKIADYLPRDKEAGHWRRLMTEVQMLFHAHPVNVDRANNAKLPINGLWFWGGRQLTQYEPVDNLTLVTTDAYARGLAQALNIQSTPPQQFDSANVANDTVIVELSVYEAWLSGDQQGLLKAKQALHDQWIAPAQQAVVAGAVSEFLLDGCEGQAICERPKKVKRGFSFERFSFRKLFTSSSNR